MRLNDAKTLCLKLMADHGLAHWNFTWINSKRIFGQCQYRDRAIALSPHLVEVNSVDEVTDTILHEIAHALAGLKAGHGPLWVMVAKRIGCTGSRCFSWDTVVQPPVAGAWRGQCECPGYTYRKFKPGPRVFCKKCHKLINFEKP